MISTVRLAAAGLTVCLALAGCGRSEPGMTAEGGDPDRGRTAILGYGCVSCHVIPGLPEARARVGPDLDNLATRRLIAGQHPNQPEVLVRWLQEPQTMRPGSGMPDMGVTEQDARDIAAYLYER
jgi:cytochrome c